MRAFNCDAVARSRASFARASPKRSRRVDGDREEDEDDWDMLTFCPTCGNLLMLERECGAGDVDASSLAGGSGLVRLRCAACPYAYEVVHGVKQRVQNTKKVVDDVLGGDEAWKNVDKTAATCPKCEHEEAYFMQIQIRSADEPMSVFYKCVGCAHQWREG